MGRRLRSLETGKHFFDGKVVAVGEAGIEVEVEGEGAVRIALGQ